MRHGPADSFRGVPPAQNLEAAGLRAQHPTWTQEQAAGEVRKIFRAAHA